MQALAPVDSRNRGVGAAKKVVRKAVFFTVHHVTEQMRALGWAATSVGDAAAERIEALEARVHELETRIAGSTATSRGTRRDRDRGPSVPFDVRRAATRSGCTRSGCAGCCATRASTSDIYAVDTHDDVRGEALDPTTFRAGRAPTSDAWILYHFSIGSPLFDSVRELDRSARARLPQHHRREILLAMGAARRDDACSKVAASSPSPRRRCASHSPTRVQRARAHRARLPAHGRRADPHRLRRLRPPPDATLLAERRRTCGRGRVRLAGGRAHRAEQVPARRPARVRGVPPHPRPSSPADLRRRAERRPLLAGAAPPRGRSRRRRRGHVHRRRQPRRACSRTTERPTSSCCLSEHEGFNVPVVEAMHFDVPGRRVRVVRRARHRR